MMRLFCTGLLIVLAFSGAKSQGCIVPKSYSFKFAKDYQEHEAAVFECMSWLAQKRMNEDRAVRSQALIYVMLWLSGAPSMTVNTYSEFLVFENECPEMVPEFINLLALEIRKSATNREDKIHFSAMKELIHLYKKSEGLNCPSLDFLAAKSDNELEIWISVQYMLAVGEH